MKKDELKFQVEAKNMPEFTSTLIDFEMDNEIIGITEDDEIIVHVIFDDDQQEGIGNLLQISTLFEDEDDDEIEEDEEED
jgi:hypothetical protein